jgi:PST family polysaccharide transporter
MVPFGGERMTIKPPGHAASDSSVTQLASRAFRWSFLNTVASRLGPLVIGIALARVLGPEQFGVFAIATVTLMAVLSFNELGVSLAIIRWRDDPATIAPTTNTISVLSSALLTAAVVVGAPWISTALGDVRATPVVQVMALSIVINGLVATPAALLQREFMQKQRTIADQVKTWLGAGISLTLALFGWGAMSLAIGHLVASVVFALMLWRWSPLPYRFGWNKAIVPKLFRFGIPLALSSIVLCASGYADQMIVGSVLGAQALGLYVLAFNLASWPVSIFSHPVRAVAPAAFSALKHDPPRMSRSFSRILALLSSVALPVCLALSGAAEPVVGFVYGGAWQASADVLLWLAALAALRIWFELAYDYLVVIGKSGGVLLIQACSFAVSLPVMLFAVQPFGEAGVATAQFLVALAVVLPLYAITLHRSGVRIGASARAVAIPIGAALLVWPASWAFAQFIDIPFLAAGAAGMLAAAVIGALVYRLRGDVKALRVSGRAKGAA